MVYTCKHFAEPHLFVDLLGKLSPQQRDFVYGEMDILSASPNRRKESRRRLHGGRLRKPGGGRKPLSARSEYITALKKVVKVLRSSTSQLVYSTQSARGIADAMKLQGVPCSSASIPRLAESIGLRVHPRIKPSPRIKPIKSADQFKFIGHRLEHVLRRETGYALHITTYINPNTAVNCPADRLATWRGKALATRVQQFLNTQQDYFTTKKIDELMLIVEGGGLLGLRNKHLPRVLQAFACLTGITIFLSHLPSGLSRFSTYQVEDEVFSLTKNQWQLGDIRLLIGQLKKKEYDPPSNSIAGSDRSTTWNRIIRPITFNSHSTDDIQITPPSNDIQDATVGDNTDTRCTAGD